MVGLHFGVLVTRFHISSECQGETTRTRSPSSHSPYGVQGGTPRPSVAKLNSYRNNRIYTKTEEPFNFLAFRCETIDKFASAILFQCHGGISLLPPHAKQNPCLSCGACCAHFRVSFYWAECDDATEGGVPVHLTKKLNDFRRVFLGTEGPHSRCIALSGEIGQNVTCAIYERRASVCHDFHASWRDGEPNPRCDQARAAWGLPPLAPTSWEARDHGRKIEEEAMGAPHDPEREPPVAITLRSDDSPWASWVASGAPPSGGSAAL